MKPLFTEEEYKKARTEDFLMVECEFCKNPFKARKKYINVVLSGRRAFIIKFCSKNCQAKSQSENGNKICECKNCGIFFKKKVSQIKKTKSNFCSQSCAAIYNNTHKTTGTRRSKFEIWIEEQLGKEFPLLEIWFNKKTEINSELDIFIPKLKLAFELNGIFHYHPIYGVDKFFKILRNDISKRELCSKKGIKIICLNLSKFKRFNLVQAQFFYNRIKINIQRELDKQVEQN